jgi:hypothetical protein
MRMIEGPCAECVWWHRLGADPGAGPDWGECRLGSSEELAGVPNASRLFRVGVDSHVAGYAGRLTTAATFGCVEWARAGREFVLR